MTHEEIQQFQRKAAELRIEHRDLDDVITRMTRDPNADQFQVKRLKKRKLHLKDQISLIESKLIPDLNA